MYSAMEWENKLFLLEVRLFNPEFPNCLIKILLGPRDLTPF